jgi:hypothetical protein
VWHFSHVKSVALILLVSATRLSSFAVLRLKLCGKTVLDCPMQDRHFHFMLFQGLWHYLISDVPRILITLAELFSDNANDKICGKQWVPLSASWAKHVTIATLATTCMSVVAGIIIKRSGIIARNARTQSREDSPQPLAMRPSLMNAFAALVSAGYNVTPDCGGGHDALLNVATREHSNLSPVVGGSE